MTLDIIIVNYNVKYYLAQCLDAVRHAIVGLDADVWVVDNNSSDRSVDFLEPMFPEVHFIRSKENAGFSKANNIAIRQSKGKYVLLLNPDTIVTSKTIKDCIHLLDDHSEIGSVGVSMYNVDGTFARESKRAVPTASVSFFKMTGLGTLFPKHKVLAKYHLGYLEPDQPHEIEIISGAFNMIRRKALDEIGLLDEDFFMYGEDVDLSYRMLKAGWKNWYLPSPMLHYKGESAHPSTIRYVNVFYQAMIIFYDKHFGGRYSLSAWLIRLAVYFKALLTLGMHFVNFCKRKLNPSSSPVTLCLQCEDSFKDKLSHILIINNVQVVPDKSQADLILYQKGVTSYDEMLGDLLGQNGKKRYQLVVFDPEQNVIIMPRSIIHC